jgi:hypothetical protein
MIKMNDQNPLGPILNHFGSFFSLAGDDDADTEGWGPLETSASKFGEVGRSIAWDMMAEASGAGT